MRPSSRFAVVCVILSLLLAQLACNLPIGKPAASQPQNITIQLSPLASQKVAPSSQEQTIAYTDQVKVVLPGGLLQAEDTLVISKPGNLPPAPSAARKLLGAYDISLGSQHELAQPLRLEISYDPKALKSGLSAADQLTAAFWDTDYNQWMTVPSTVDEQQHKIFITTDHLSLYAYFNWAVGYSVFPFGHFRIVYDKKEVVSIAGNYKPATAHGPSSEPDFVLDAGDFLETAYQNYQKAGYPVPDGEINVEIQSQDYSEYGTLSGIIHITTLAWPDQNLLRQDCAHELFHSVQLKALGISKYRNRQWWSDAAADYAADRIAYGANRTGKMGIDIKPKYLETAITSNANFHAYSTAHFISWLVDKQNVMSFKELFDATNAGENDVLATLKKLIDSPKPLGLHFSEFGLFFIFDAASPGPLNTVSAISTQIAAQADTLKPDSEPLEKAFSVNYFTAQLWAVQSTEEADLMIERRDQNNGAVWVVVQSGDTRGASQLVQPEIMNGSTTLHLSPGQYLYIMADNTTNPEPQNISVRISILNFPSGTFPLTLYADTGCDAGLEASGGYNNNSSILHNLPMVIKGKKFTLAYDKTTGAKHLVASGSGSLDQDGILVFNYDINYTITRTNSNGVETASGTLTLTWDPIRKQWAGPGSGPITVSHPADTKEMKSWYCNANITRAKIDTNSAFVDTDR